MSGPSEFVAFYGKKHIVHKPILARGYRAAHTAEPITWVEKFDHASYFLRRFQKSNPNPADFVQEIVTIINTHTE